MEVTLKQAIILALIANQPGVTGPKLTLRLAGLVPTLNVPQHLARLEKRGLIAVTKVPGARAKQNSYHLTVEGQKELDAAKEVAKFLLT